MFEKIENISLMEPLTISIDSRHRAELIDLVMDLITISTGFQRSLPPAIKTSLANTVRSMNCYYSNLIEGHNTHPIDIEKALKGKYSKNKVKRNLQLEAKAHISVQKWIDAGGIKENPYSEKNLREIHYRFCTLLPEELLWVEDPQTHKKVKVIAGEFREEPVKVGNHIAIQPSSIPQFLNRFEKFYNQLSKTEAILSLAASHHRLLWIHPFLDGNGRVARLMSHSLTLTLLNSEGLWSISRGLARNVNAYKSHLANCDLQKRNDLDGRGNLSEESLVEFIKFFLNICIDQVKFMENLIQPDKLRARILLWAREEVQLGELTSKSFQILEAILYRGEITRKELSEVLNISDRHTRRLVTPLMNKGILISDNTKSPLRLAFPAELAGRWLPGLFPG